MGIADRTVVEMEQRASLLKEEVDAWNTQANLNIDQFGRHRSQLGELQVMMNNLFQKQKPLLGQLTPDLDAQGFEAAYARLVSAIVGAHELWSVFRLMFDQILDPHLRSSLKAANWVAADCYLAHLGRAKIWKLVSENQLREPPLVYLAAVSSAATAGRGREVQALGLTVNRYRSQRLPIPIVLLPFDQAGLLWLLCPLLHEVGHNVDQDLKLSDELQAYLDIALAAEQVPAGRCKVWKQWTIEILADALGVISGGAGFGHGLAAMLLVLAPKSVSLDTTDSHPDLYVRLHLLAALLDQAGVAALGQVASSVRTGVQALPAPTGGKGYIQDCAAVAKVFLSQPLNALGNHTLQDLNPNLASEAKSVAELTKYLRTDSGFDEPLTPLPARLVPCAAELAWAELDKPDLAALQQLQARSVSYLSGLNQPEFLAAVNRSEFMKQLADDIRFEEVIP